MLSNNKPGTLKWATEYRNAFEHLNSKNPDIPATVPTLADMGSEAMFIMGAGASNVGLSGVMLQDHGLASSLSNTLHANGMLQSETTTMLTSSKLSRRQPRLNTFGCTFRGRNMLHWLLEHGFLSMDLEVNVLISTVVEN